MPFELRRQHVLAALKRTPWHTSNEILYRLCRQHSAHEDIEIILAKILLIGRVYAAAIERRRQSTTKNDDYYLSIVEPCIRKSKIDVWIETARNVTPGSAKAFETIVEVHKRTTSLFAAISGLEKRSLASKYLHFHVPGLFYLYDTRSVAGMRRLSAISGRSSGGFQLEDSEYRKFAEKCVRVQQYCRDRFSLALKPRNLDNLLLAMSTM